MSPKHYQDPGHLHYLTFSCYRKLWLFKSPSLYANFLKILQQARLRLRFKLYGFVLMPNHVHLLLYPEPDLSLSTILRAIKQPSAYSGLNYLAAHQPALHAQLEVNRGGQSEHRFWQAGGGYDRNIYRDETFVHTLEYMHYNPVRKKLVTSPRDWPWSSARFYESKIPEPIALDWPEWW